MFLPAWVCIFPTWVGEKKLHMDLDENLTGCWVTTQEWNDLKWSPPNATFGSNIQIIRRPTRMNEVTTRERGSRCHPIWVDRTVVWEEFGQSGSISMIIKGKRIQNNIVLSLENLKIYRSDVSFLWLSIVRVFSFGQWNTRSSTTPSRQPLSEQSCLKT